MPTSEEILGGATQLANEWTWLAAFWHVYFGLVILALLFGARIRKSVFAGLLALPLLSVSLLAWTVANLFNALVFVSAGMVLLIAAMAQESEDVSLGSNLQVVSGVLLAAFGWVYPHFLEPNSSAAYLTSSPLGILPCPTLTMLVGLTLVAGGLGSRVWSSMLSILGIAYGFIGVVRLGVQLDWALLIGSGLLLATTLTQQVGTPSRRDRGSMAAS
jgi:hypothetical protein